VPGLHLPAIVQTALFWFYPFELLTYCHHRWNSHFGVRATSHPLLVFISNPRDIGAILASPEGILHPGEGARTVAPIVGECSFALSDGKEHRVGRKAVVSAFRATMVNTHTRMVSEVAERTSECWPIDKIVELDPGLRSLTLEVILRVLTGRFTGRLDGRLQLLHKLVLEMLVITDNAAFVEPKLRHGPGRHVWRYFLHSRAEVDKLLGELIDERVERGSAGDLLGKLAALPDADGLPPSRERVRDNAMSVIVAGHETTAAQLAWAFQLLAHNPRVLDRLHREIDDGQSEDYLTATIQEVLRHRCAFVFAIPRVVVQPVTIGGHTYHPPTHLLACTYLLHHDPTIYPDPHTFRPERFLQTPPDPRTWIPWGGGRKRCPGLHLAMLEMKTVLRTVLANRTLQPASRRIERPRWRSVIVTPQAGSRVILRRR
jgi:cytochrome P450